jgi:uncharacterized membrane-anchored protein YjiN (DUF445 family)
MPPPTLPASDPDTADRRELFQHRAFATALLALMAVLTLCVYGIPTAWWPSEYARAVLGAAAKAGFVGGIADWFAVTALFRHPLGLPIPHTAIIPKHKERLGLALGRFVATHVFTEKDIASVLSKLDLPGILHRFLADPAASKPLAATLAGMLPRILATVEDGRARRVVARLVPRIVGGAGASRLIARALHGLVEGGRHQEVFGFILAQLKQLIASREDALRHAIEERVREQGGRLVGWALGASIARRVLATLTTELDKMGPDGSELREAFDEWVRREVQRMEDDPARAAELGAAVRGVVSHETVQAWIWDVWARLRVSLEADAAKPNGRTMTYLEGAIGNLGAMLESDPAARVRVDAAAEGVVRTLLPSAQVRLADFIARVVAGWDAATITERLELRVGKDLQFVRVNGTLVGFLVGGALYVALRAAFGASGL